MAIFAIRPGSIGTNNALTLIAGANKVAAVDPLDPISHDDAGSYVRNSGDNVFRAQGYRLAARPAISAVTNVYGFQRARWAGAPNAAQMQMRAIMGGVTGADTTPQLMTATNTWQSTTGDGVLLPRPGGGSWTAADIFNSTLEIVALCGSANFTFDITSLYINVDALTAPVTIEAPRSRATRELRLKSRGFVSLTGIVPLVMAHDSVGDLVSITDLTGPVAVGNGWGFAAAERRATVKTETNLDLNSMELTESYFDLRRYLTTLWMTTKSERMPSLEDDGMGLMASGSSRTFTRSSKAWVTNAAAGKSGVLEYVEIGDDVKKLCTEGLLIEGASTQDIRNSIAKDGVSSNWTLTAVAGTATTLFIDAASLPLSTASWRFTRVGTGACSMASSTSYTGTLALYLSVAHADYSTGGVLTVFVQDAGDNFYWNFTTQAWQSGSTSIDLPERFNTRTMDHVGPIVVRSGARTIGISIHATTIADQLNDVYYVGTSRSRWPSSPILTQSSAVTRDADDFQVSNDATATMINASVGTFFAPIMPNWNSVDITTGAYVFHVWRVVYDASNRMALYYDGNSSEWRFAVVVGATIFLATIDSAVVRGNAHKVACRWTATTASIFADGVKGKDVALTSGPCVQTTTSTFHLGHDETPANHLEGNFSSEIDFAQFAWTDEEIIGRML